MSDVAQAVGMREALEEALLAMRPFYDEAFTMDPTKGHKNTLVSRSMGLGEWKAIEQAFVAASRALAAQPPAAPVEKIGRTDREGGWNAGRDIAHQHSSAEIGGQEG